MTTLVSAVGEGASDFGWVALEIFVGLTGVALVCTTGATTFDLFSPCETVAASEGDVVPVVAAAVVFTCAGDASVGMDGRVVSVTLLSFVASPVSAAGFTDVGAGAGVGADLDAGAGAGLDAGVDAGAAAIGWGVGAGVCAVALLDAGAAAGAEPDSIATAASWVGAGAVTGAVTGAGAGAGAAAGTGAAAIGGDVSVADAFDVAGAVASVCVAFIDVLSGIGGRVGRLNVEGATTATAASDGSGWLDAGLSTEACFCG